MALLSASVLKRIERDNPRGVSSALIVKLFSDAGEKFSAATLRKYVQLGLLPKSRRVGSRGRHRGSSGLYPPEAVSLINEIKKSLVEGATLEEIHFGPVGLLGEVQVLQRVFEHLVKRFEEALSHQPASPKLGSAQKELGKNRQAGRQMIRNLGKLAGRLAQPRIES